jgi:predicted nucleic acid-binding protein
MTTGGANGVFLDTNVLVNANVAAAPLHAEALIAIREYVRLGVPLWVSRQVLREYLAVLSRPQVFSRPLHPQVLVARVQQFESRFRVANEDPDVTARLLTLMEPVPVGGKQVHDANIVATMLVQSVDPLLTANPSDFVRFSRLITVLPLAAGSSA